ncbi:hypothetical protein DICVIV_09564 [Dictyocaulus viviparus]|uniref:Uncharacterized protein n=1 Tax=Dictyocaulus viviparus TaxID=29172 RepID=A0A0D8XIH8_DICVI|nr:hypothetical protein DICVIV_09564 [Dictyocaulus viviparus]
MHRQLPLRYTLPDDVSVKKNESKIYDEFRFLDETEVPSPASSAHPIINTNESSVNCKRRFTPSLIAYCLLPLIQLTISIGLILLAVFRLQQIFQIPLSTNSLIDFDKPEGQISLGEESSKTLKIRSAISVLIPAAFQCVAAIAGFWPLIERYRSYYQFIHIIFCGLAVLQWLSSVQAVSIEINQTFIQIHEWYQMSSYLIYIILLCAASFGAIILPSITICIAASQLSPYSRQSKSNVVRMSLALGVVLISVTTCCFSAYTTSRSMTNVTQWRISPALANQLLLYSFALKEAIVSSYVLLSSVFFFIATVQQNHGIYLASSVIQMICILALCQLLIPSRLTAVLINSRVLSIDKTAYPVAQVNVILLYAFIMALLFLLSIQFLSTIILLRRHSTTANTPSSSVAYSQQRTNF